MTSARGPADERFVETIVAAADARVDELLLAEDIAEQPFLPHRELMRRAKILVACVVSSASRHHGDARLLTFAEQIVADLRALQGPSGLFIGGDNVDSPPDSAFTINDVGDTFAVLSLSDTREPGAVVERLGVALTRIALAAKAALLAGGVHTPNHRWELSAALARTHRSWPDPALPERIGVWLGEHVDIDAEGFYSERSPKYSAHVSNPSLTAIADILDRPELLDAVEQNLTATLDLIRPDGSIETVQSRRQDQKSSFRLADFLLQFRRFAIDRARGDFAWAADEALRQPVDDAGASLTELLLHPRLGEALPAIAAPEPTRRSYFPGVQLASNVQGPTTLVVYGGSDYASHGRIRSGLANNPTFARFFAGDAILDTVRLSRDFFGYGPFRSAGMTVDADSFLLTETVGASYYLPLAAGQVRSDGSYALVDDGRFSAAMDFGSRETSDVSLTTSVRVTSTDDGVDLTIDVLGPVVSWALELTFRPGGVFEGVRSVADGAELVEGFGRYRVGSDEIVFGPGNGSGPDRPPLYRPGQDYSFLDGTDATAGEHVYITGRSPGSFTLTLQAATAR